MNAQIIDAIRQLHLKPGESVSVEVDGGTVELWWRSPAPEPGAPSPDPPGTVYRLVRFSPMGPPEPYRFDENDLAPGNLGDEHDLPVPGT